ncbi:MAG: hypothetical protein IPM36_02610 [Lewinellaceae bacterium]|nr:hypothetical protein [Lewinellaceae bacterium]
MKNLTLALLGALALFFACRTDQPESPAPNANYSNLAVGNYWVYDQYYLDTNGVYTPLGRTDSNFVEKDTLINGQLYFKLMEALPEGPLPGHRPVFLRDSLHYIVDWQGTIRFSSENTVDTLTSRYFTAIYHPPAVDTFAFIFGKMETPDVQIQTPAGTFTAKNFRETYRMWPAYSNAGDTRRVDHHYVQDVGIVDETLYFYINNPEYYIVRRLTKYGTQ